MAAILDFNATPKYEADAGGLYNNRKITSLGYTLHDSPFDRIVQEKKYYYDDVID